MAIVARPALVAGLLRAGYDPDREFAQIYLALKYHLGYMTFAPGDESLADPLAKFALFTLKSFGHGLAFVADRVFNLLRRKTEKTLLSYTNTTGVWKSRVWKNLRNIDGVKFDDYMLSVPPYAVLKDRVNAVLAIHQALANVTGIYDGSVAQGNYWLTTDCQKAIDAMAKIGFDARNHDILVESISETYKRATIRQSMFMHKYTLKNIMELFNKVQQIAEYASPAYIEKYQKKFDACIDKLNDAEGAIIEDDNDEKLTEKEKAAREYEISMRAARLWWITHFIRSAYLVTSDIFTVLEKLTAVTEKCIATTSID